MHDLSYNSYYKLLSISVVMCKSTFMATRHDMPIKGIAILLYILQHVNGYIYYLYCFTKQSQDFLLYLIIILASWHSIANW